jgi:hypothetical protein
MKIGNVFYALLIVALIGIGILAACAEAPDDGSGTDSGLTTSDPNVTITNIRKGSVTRGTYRIVDRTSNLTCIAIVDSDGVGISCVSTTR